MVAALGAGASAVPVAAGRGPAASKGRAAVTPVEGAAARIAGVKSAAATGRGARRASGTGREAGAPMPVAQPAATVRAGPRAFGIGLEVGRETEPIGPRAGMASGARAARRRERGSSGGPARAIAAVSGAARAVRSARAQADLVPAESRGSAKIGRTVTGRRAVGRGHRKELAIVRPARAAGAVVAKTGRGAHRDFETGPAAIVETAVRCEPRAATGHS